MTVVPNIRVNALVPFPALVQPSGPITVTKVNGIWTIGFGITGFGTVIPGPTAWPTDFLLGFDSVAGTFFKISISALAASLQGARNQRLVTASPIVVGANDSIINVNIAAGAMACALPGYASRLGLPLTFKDVGRNFSASHQLTLTPLGAETIEGSNTPLVLQNPSMSVTLVPANDGTTTGWWIE